MGLSDCLTSALPPSHGQQQTSTLDRQLLACMPVQMAPDCSLWRGEAVTRLLCFSQLAAWPLSLLHQKFMLSFAQAPTAFLWCRDGSLAGCVTLSGVGVVHTSELVRGPDEVVHAAMLSADGRHVALAWQDRCTVVEAPWSQSDCQRLGEYVCPRVSTSCTA